MRKLIFKQCCHVLLCLLPLSWLGCSEQKEADTSALTRPLPSAPAPTPDPHATDLKRVVKGTTAPDFALEAPDGETYKLSNFRAKKFVVLVFYRGYF